MNQHLIIKQLPISREPMILIDIMWKMQNLQYTLLKEQEETIILCQMRFVITFLIKKDPSSQYTVS